MLKIYHNTRCGKSRGALQEMEALGQPYEVVEYLKNPPDEKELKQLLEWMGKKPLDVIRQKEPVFQENFKGENFSDEEWIRIIAENPILLERPIVVSGNKAWIAREKAGLEAIAGIV